MKSVGRLFTSLSLGGLAALVPGVAAAQPPPVSCTEAAILRSSLDRAEQRFTDWPDLGRYRAANAALRRPTRRERRVVFMGDSITDNWSKDGHGGFFPGKPYVNRGIGGQTTPQMLVRFRADVIALDPEVVVILAGTNDIARRADPARDAEIRDNLASMAELARAHGIRVVLASILPVSDHERDERGRPRLQTNRRPPARILELNRWIQRHAAANGHVHLDYFAAMVDARGRLKRELSDDGLHPDASGYRVMALLAERAIQAALAVKREPSRPSGR